MEYPIYNVVFQKNKTGLKKVSLVSDPAFGVKFSKFSENNTETISSKFNIIDEDKRIVFGPVIIPDTPIFRTDRNNSYYVNFDKDTIISYRDQFFEDNHNLDVNLEHTLDVDSAVCIISLIKGEIISNIPGYDDLPDGTWFLGYKINNDVIWNEIKNETFIGFSQEILYIIEDTDKIIIDNKITSNMKKTKSTLFHSHRKFTGKSVRYSQFGSVTTDRGILSYDGELILEKEDVTLTTPDGDTLTADGSFTIMEDDERNGRVVVIDNGVIVEYDGPEMMPDNTSANLQTALQLIEDSIENQDKLVEYVMEENAKLHDLIEDAIEESFTKKVCELINSKFEAMQSSLKKPGITPKTEKFESQDPQSWSEAAFGKPKIK